MSRKDIITEIILSFDSCAEEFKENNGALICEIKSEYKGSGIESEDIKYHYAKIYFNSYIIVFKYTAHGAMSLVNSILECYISFDKSNEQVLYPVYQVMDIIDENNFDCFTFPYITNGSVMGECFEKLGNSTQKLLSKIEEVSYNQSEKEKLFSNFLNELSYIFKTKVTPDNYTILLPAYYNFLTNRYTCGPYMNFAAGNYTKAAKKYKKLKNKSRYEKRLLEEIKKRIVKNGLTGEAELPQVILSNMEKYNSHGSPKQGIREFTAVFTTAFVFTFIWAIPFCLLFYGMLAIEKINSLYLTGPEVFSMFLPSFLMGILTSYYTRHKSYKLLFKKDYMKLLEMDYITNSPGTDKFMKGFSAIIFIGCIIFTALNVKWNIKFMQDGFIDNTKFLSVNGYYYSYSQVKKAYYKPSRVNDFGDTLNYPSYVIVLKNGKEIDLYQYEDIIKSREKVLPILKEKGIEID